MSLSFSQIFSLSCEFLAVSPPLPLNKGVGKMARLSADTASQVTLPCRSHQISTLPDFSPAPFSVG